MERTISICLVITIVAAAVLINLLPLKSVKASIAQVSYIKITNNPLFLGSRKIMIFNYGLNRKSWITAQIIRNKRIVMTIKTNYLKTAGANSLSWYGKDSYGRYVGVGTYIFRLIAKDYRTMRNHIYYRDVFVRQPYNKSIGVAVDGNPSTGVPQLEQLTGYKFRSYQRFQSSTYDFDRLLADWLYTRGMTMELCWMPRDPSNPSINQSGYRLSTIIRGNHDAMIRRWARQMKDFGKTVYFRPMAEMNDAKTWGGSYNGNSPSEFIPAWRHVYNIFKQEGALNVKFVWCPNRDSSYEKAEATFKTYYPGDSYVDFTGLDGYNFGTIYPTSRWRNLDEVLRYSYTVFARRTAKPMVISEIASTEQGGNKAAWTKDFLLKMKYSYPRIKRVYWFNINKQTDFRIQSSQDNLNSFRTYSK